MASCPVAPCALPIWSACWPPHCFSPVLFPPAASLAETLPGSFCTRDSPGLGSFTFCERLFSEISYLRVLVGVCIFISSICFLSSACWLSSRTIGHVCSLSGVAQCPPGVTRLCLMRAGWWVRGASCAHVALAGWQE